MPCRSVCGRWRTPRWPPSRADPDASAWRARRTVGHDGGRERCNGDRHGRPDHRRGWSGRVRRPCPAPGHPPHRRRARRRREPGARGGRAPRRRRDGAVRRPLPQGGDGRSRRRAAAHARGAPDLPARARGAPFRGARVGPWPGQAGRRARRAHPRRGDEEPPGGRLPPVQAEAAHQGRDRPRGRPRAAGRRAADRPHPHPAHRGRRLRRPGPRACPTATPPSRAPARSSSSAGRRTPTSWASSASRCGAAGGSRPPTATGAAARATPRPRSSPTTAPSTRSSPACRRTGSSPCCAARPRRSWRSRSTRSPRTTTRPRSPTSTSHASPRPSASPTAADPPTAGSPTRVRWAWRTRILSRLVVDLRVRLREVAEEGAVLVFAGNLRDLLLAAPAGARPTLGLDPGLRTGVKVAVIDGTGKVVATDTIHPHVPRRQWEASRTRLGELAREHGVELVAIGNGTASRETHALVRDLIAREPDLGLTAAVVSRGRRVGVLGLRARVGRAARPRRVAARRGLDRAAPAGPAGRAREDRPEVDRRRPVPARRRRARPCRARWTPSSRTA